MQVLFQQPKACSRCVYLNTEHLNTHRCFHRPEIHSINLRWRDVEEGTE